MPSRVKLASLVTVLALGALAAVAFASGSGGADPTAVQTRDDQPATQVRTEVVRRTVHRRAPAPSSSGSGRSAAGDAGSGRSAAAVAQPAAVASPSATPDDHGRHGVGELGDDHGRRHGGHGDDDDGFDDDDDGDDDDSGDGSSGRDDDDGHRRGRGRGGDDD